MYFIFAYYFTHDLCPFHLDGNGCLKKETGIFNQIFSDCICFIFIAVVLSKSVFCLEVTDLLNFTAVSSRCWTDFFRISEQLSV